MPQEPGMRTSGPVDVKKVGSETKLNRDDAGDRDKNDDDLQRALEREVVDRLRDENEKLVAELAALRAGRVQGEAGSISQTPTSWEEVNEVSQLKEPMQPGHVTKERDVSRSPRMRPGESMLGVARFTPGGTRVPDGPPPIDDEEPRPNPPPLPSFPPLSRDDGVARMGLADYEMVESRGRVKRVDHQWQPSGRPDVPTPGDAKAFWMEREVESFRAMLEQQFAGNSFANDEYWSRPSAVRPSKLHGHREEDRASQLHGHREESRASQLHGHREGDRASWQHGVRGEDQLHRESVDRRATMYRSDRGEHRQAEGDLNLGASSLRDAGREINDRDAVRNCSMYDTYHLSIAIACVYCILLPSDMQPNGPQVTGLLRSNSI